jgi:hypothetical protein
MIEEIVQTLAQELHVSEDLVQSAVSQADGELEKAREILLSILPRYLVIKVKYIISRSDGECGLIYICIERNSPDFRLFRIIVDTSADWIDGIDVRGPVDRFYMVLSERSSHPRSVSSVHEAQKLQERLMRYLVPSAFARFFDSWNVPKPDFILEKTAGKEEAKSEEKPPEAAETPDESLEHPGGTAGERKPGPRADSLVDRLRGMFKFALEEITYKRIEELEVDYDFMTSAKYSEILERLGIKPPDKAKARTEAGSEEKETFRLFLKGRILIDPTGGTPVDELDLGDLVFCDILDRSEVAQSAAQMIGVYKRGLWMPVRGRIKEMKRLEGDRYRIRIKLATGIYIDTVAFQNLRVRQHALSGQGETLSSRSSQNSASPLTLMIGILLVAALIMAFLMMR